MRTGVHSKPIPNCNICLSCDGIRKETQGWEWSSRLWEGKVTKGVESGQNQASARMQLQETMWPCLGISRYFPGDTLRGRKDREMRLYVPLASGYCGPVTLLCSLFLFNEIVCENTNSALLPG